MNYMIVFFVLISLSVNIWAQNAFKVYINEIRANDASTDDIEFIEIVGPAGTDITGFKLIHYNGADTQDGGLWTHVIGDILGGSFIIPDDGVTDNSGTALGFYVLGVNTNAGSIPNVDEALTAETLQNGPDGIILFDASDNILDAVAWQGAGDLPVDDPGTVTTSPPTEADNYLHVTADDDGVDNSLQAPDNVLGDDGSGWSLGSATSGTINFNQISGDINLPVSLSSFTATAGNNKVTLRWVTASEQDNVGFKILRANEKNGNYQQLSSYENNPELEGQFNSNKQTNYKFTDETVTNGVTYWYKLVDVDVNGVHTEHGPMSATPHAVGNEITTINAIPAGSFNLHPNYPNPFNPSTTLRFDIPALSSGQQTVEMIIFNSQGQKIRTVFKGALTAGTHELSWNGISDIGEPVSSGMYYAVLKMENLVRTTKLLLVK